MLAAEVARYLNISPVFADKILAECDDGIDTVIEKVSKYNDVLFDIVIPTVFNALYEVKSSVITEDREVELLRLPEGKEFYEFLADETLVATQNEAEFEKKDKSGIVAKDKSFHTDTYCFDSKPEKECFLQYIFSDRVKEVYFTGMFTSKYNGLLIQYIDPETNAIRSYYPDFITTLDDGTIQIIEVKGDNKIDDNVVIAKASAAEEMASESKMQYIMLPSTKIMKERII